MAVPKKRVSDQRRRMRYTHLAFKFKEYKMCECGEPRLTHQACTFCGKYKGRVVLPRVLKAMERRTKNRENSIIA